MCAVSVGFVTPEGPLDVFAFHRVEAPREDGCIFDRCRGTLCHVGSHRMCGIAKQHDPAIAPAAQGLALKDRPFMAVRARVQHAADILMKIIIGRA